MHSTIQPPRGCIVLSRHGVAARFEDFDDLYGALADAFALKGLPGRWLVERMREAGYVDAFTTSKTIAPDGRASYRALGDYRIAYADGEPIALAAIGAESLRRWRAGRAKPAHAGHVFRDGPVPGIGHGWGRARWCRAMRTTQERREARAHDDEIVAAGRPAAAARRVRDVPTSWSDVGRQVERSWKRHRATRWRRVAAM